MRNTVKIGCAVLGLFVASYQQGATDASPRKNQSQSNPPAAAQAPSSETTGYKRDSTVPSAVPARAAQTREVVLPTGLKHDAIAAAVAAGPINHLDRRAVEARRASPPGADSRRAGAPPAGTANPRAATGHQTLPEQSTPSAARQTATEAGPKAHLTRSPLSRALQAAPESVQRPKAIEAVAPAGTVTRLNREAVEARHRTVDSGRSPHAVPETPPRDAQLPARQPRN